jgi:hypothetical protein
LHLNPFAYLTMKPISAAIAFAALSLVGCAGWQRLPTYPDTRQSNAIEYDAYVNHRSAELIAGGKNANDARLIANDEANRRFGTRIEGGATQSATIHWTNDNGKPVSLAELDQTVAGMKKR